MKFYYADQSNIPVGPYTLEELKQLNLSGVVSPETLICGEGQSAWQPYRNLQITNVAVGGLPPTAPPPQAVNAGKVSVGNAVLWFLCCIPIGFTLWGQAAKGWIWVLASVLTGGLAGLVAIVDYWMCYSIQEKRKLGEWEFFPR